MYIGYKIGLIINQLEDLGFLPTVHCFTEEFFFFFTVALNIFSHVRKNHEMYSG